MAGVAQSVERRTVDAAVAGSSPVARPIKETGPVTGFLLLGTKSFVRTSSLKFIVGKQIPFTESCSQETPENLSPSEPLDPGSIFLIF